METKMRIFLTGLLLTCAACSQMETTLISPKVPAELRQPVEVQLRDATSLRDVALILTDYVEALEAANGKIVAIDEILTQFEARLSTKGGPACFLKDVMLRILIERGGEMVDQTAIEVPDGVVMVEMWAFPDSSYVLTVRDDAQMCVFAEGADLRGRRLADFLDGAAA